MKRVAWSKCGPLFWWGTLVGAIGVGLLCLMVILRKQWVGNERLEYPLVALGCG